MIHCQAVYFDTSLNHRDLHSMSQLYEKVNIFALIFLHISQLIRMKFRALPGQDGLLTLMLNSVCRVNVQRKEPYLDAGFFSFQIYL